MRDIAECERLLKEARAREEHAYRIATGALSGAIRAKYDALHAWIELAQARGSKDDFRETYNECVTLLDRAEHHCERYVRRALSTDLLSKFGV